MRPYLVGSFFDDGVYVVLGKALATGQGYRYLHLPGHPAAIHYPPAYPLLLAALWRIAPAFPGNVAVFQLANALLLVAAALGSYSFGRARLRLTVAWSAAIAIGGTVAIPMLAQTTMLISEPLFIALLMPTLLLSERATDDDASHMHALAAGALAGALGLVRTLGIAVIPASVAIATARRRPRTALWLGGTALAVLLPWQLWVAAHSADLAPELRGAYGSYGSWLLDAVRRHGLAFAVGTANMNILALLRIPLVQMTPGWPLWSKLVVLAGAVLLFSVGVRRFARAAPIAAAFYLLYLVAVLLWPFPPYRFFWTLWPLTLMVLALGARIVWAWRPVGRATPVWRAVALCAATSPAIAFLQYNVTGYRAQWWRALQDGLEPQVASVLHAVAVVPASRAPIVSEQAPAVYLYANREGVPATGSVADGYVYGPDATRARTDLEAVLRRFPARYVIASSPEIIAAAERLTRETPPVLVPLQSAATAAGTVTYARADR
jgi:hypothetical protein